MSKFLVTLFALLCSLGFTSLTAQEGEKPAKATGEIVSCADGSLVISVPAKEGGEATELTVTVNESTVITIDGVAGTAEGLVAGKKATVLHNAENVASAVTIGKKPKPPKEPKQPKEEPKAPAEGEAPAEDQAPAEGETAPPME